MRAPASWLRAAAGLALVILALGGSAAAAPARRVALVIGQSAYVGAGELPNGRNDARLVASALLSAGFDQVDLRIDLDRKGLDAALSRFARTARGADTAVIYFAGHGVESGGRNWLIPIDARLESEARLKDQAVALDLALAALKPAVRLRVLVLDACRNNPFRRGARSGDRPTAAQRLVIRGLGAVESPDTLIFYAAKAGSTALDGDGDNSPFALALAARIPTPGVEVRRLFGQVRDDVLLATGGEQEPFSYGAAPARAYLTPTDAEVALTDADALGWDRARLIDSGDAYAEYLSLFPMGRHWREAAVLRARRRAEMVRAGPVGFAGRTIRVAANGTGDASDLTAAVAQAKDGDRILLSAGIHRAGDLTINKRILIAGPSSGKPAVVQRSTDGKLSSLIFVEYGGDLWIQDVTLQCACDLLSLFEGRATIGRVVFASLPGLDPDDPFSDDGLNLYPGSSAILVDSRADNGAGGLSISGALDAVGNRLNGTGWVSGNSRAVFLENSIVAPKGKAVQFSGLAWALLEANEIDLRGRPIDKDAKSTLISWLTHAAGRLVLSRNTLRLNSAAPEVQWFLCKDVERCDVTLDDNRVLRDPPGRPAVKPRGRGRRGG